MPYDKRDVPSDGEPYWNEKWSMYMREGTTDDQLITEMKAYEILGMQNGEKILDLGAHIGSFVRQVYLPEFCREDCIVLAFEPDPDNYALLQKNTIRYLEEGVRDKNNFPRVKLVQAAVAWDREGQVPFYLNTKRCKGSHSIEQYSRRPAIEVKSVRFDDVVHYFQPDRIKMDIEGSEIDILSYTVLPSYVKALLAEVHLNREDWRDRAGEIDVNLKQQGFKDVEPMKIGLKNWHTRVCYRRD